LNLLFHTEQLQDTAFQRASYGFTVFAIVGPLCAFGLAFLQVLFSFVKDKGHLRQVKSQGSLSANA
jgi:hypothetical protein